MSDDAAERWARFEPGAIPSKKARPELDAFVEFLREEGLSGARVLDLGCGTGAVSARLGELGFEVSGVDINPGAVERARSVVPGASFHLRDIAAPSLELGERPFAAVVCQLVISIVGGPASRKALLENASRWLAPGGHLYLSASGVSGDVNPAYARLYDLDFPRTGERSTYFSRDDGGNILYTTHHFEEEELRFLVQDAGFADVAVAKKLESSSRRPEEAAHFLYARCRKPLE